MYDTAVGADRNVHTCLLEVLISCLSDLDDCCSLASTDTLSLACDADGTAADTDLDEIGSCICKEKESFLIDNVACSNLYCVTVMLADPADCPALPFRETF